jgi:hypothetical protein
MSGADKPELRQANDNPWYCLATMHGEQPVGGNWNKRMIETVFGGQPGESSNEILTAKIALLGTAGSVQL